MSTSRLTNTDKSARRVSHTVPAGLVDFRAIGLPGYADCYAIVVDDLYPRPTLSAILGEAERQPWKFAQINAGTEVFTAPDYRNGDRIIHDSFPLSEQIFEKLRPHLSAIEEIEQRTYVPGVGAAMQKWRMVRLNERLRFLRYPKGGFFKPHEDGCYFNEETGQRTFYTLQLYLPSDASGSEESFRPALGGATRFWGGDGAYEEPGCPYADVEALPGRALVFQHDELLHSGEEVLEGVKCTMRSDILYERVGEPVPMRRRG
ncbi:P4Hc domain-containing protein [Mycena venus]|uniref:P4Hc domain-containing protein n=1 Tax=Mycena venus TaxID=2733690 RepID=A0A8H6Y0S9_9AGAR|nr:P4Hc domain-containing protein [Mycena venus]